MFYKVNKAWSKTFSYVTRTLACEQNCVVIENVITITSREVNPPRRNYKVDKSNAGVDIPYYFLF